MISVRLPHEMVEEIDARREAIASANPGLEVGRADMIRMLLKKALEETEPAKPRRR